MSRWGMIIDLAACDGCGACVTTCRQENNVPVADEATYLHGRNQDWIQIATEVEEGPEGPVVKQYPLLCQHCDEPPCTNVCPVSATYKDEEGIVGQIYPRCIGCRYCTNACPYSVKTFNWFDPKWEDGTDRRLNPDVSTRPRGVVEKCTLCHHRLQKAREDARAEGRPMRPGEYEPACVEVCPTKAMVFGDLDDPTSEVSRLASTPRAYRMKEDLGTKPKVIYLRPRKGGSK